MYMNTDRHVDYTFQILKSEFIEKVINIKDVTSTNNVTNILQCEFITFLKLHLKAGACSNLSINDFNQFKQIDEKL